MGDYIKFIKRAAGILAAVVLVIVAGFFSHIDRGSVIYAIKYKHHLLQTEPGPRIVFVGGSNVRFGINSQLFKDSLKVNPINTALSSGLGLRLIVEDLKPYLKENDVVVLAPEYLQFYGNDVYGNPILSQTINICPEDIKTLDFAQIKVLFATLPHNNIAKMMASAKALIGKKPHIPPYEAIQSINKYGDTYIHWTMKPIPYPHIVIPGKYNPETINVIRDFSDYVTNKLKGKLFLTYPSFAQKEYGLNKDKVADVQQKMEALNIPILGKPEDFVYPDSLFFNSEYHLNKAGGIMRSNTLIKDIKPYLAGKPAGVN